MAARTLEKITVVVTVTMLGVALAAGVGAAPAALLAVALVVTVSAGMDLVLRGEARYHPTPDLFILPAALVVGAVLFLPLLASGAAIVAGLVVFGALLFAVFWFEHAMRAGQLDHRQGETVLTLITYVAAFTLYAAIYQLKTRTLISAPAILLVTLLLATRQLRLVQEGARLSETAGPAGDGQANAVPSAVPAGATAATARPASVPSPRGDGPASHTPAAGARTGTTSAQQAIVAPRARRQAGSGWGQALSYAAVVALAVSEITWALNYWPLNGLFGGAFLLSTYYFLVGTLSHHLQGRLTARLVAEYGAVAGMGMLLLALTGLTRRAA